MALYPDIFHSTGQKGEACMIHNALVGLFVIESHVSIHVCFHREIKEYKCLLLLLNI